MSAFQVPSNTLCAKAGVVARSNGKARKRNRIGMTHPLLI